MPRRIRSGLITAIATMAIATPVFAGPPLLCHPFEIGEARSLPWTSTWSQGRPDYNLDRLVADTESLLTPATPVLVRMETLRRAALYASGNRATAGELLQRLVTRATASDASGHPDALAYLDAAYVAGAFREIASLSGVREFSVRAREAAAALGNADGYALISKSVAARPDDPAIQFAAALISSDANRGRYADHAAKARAGAARDPLVARNIAHVQ